MRASTGERTDQSRQSFLASMGSMVRRLLETHGLDAVGIGKDAGVDLAAIPVPGERIAESAQGTPGYLVDGPRRPVPPGRWRTRFRVGCRLSPREQRRYGPKHPIGSVDVAVGDDDVRVLTHRASLRSARCRTPPNSTPAPFPESAAKAWR